MPPRFFAIIGLVIAISILMSFLSKRKKARAFAGVVADIRHQRRNVASDADRSPTDWVTILFDLDDGKKYKCKLRYVVFEYHYSDLAVGDRVVKVPGEYLAKKETPAPETADTPAGQ